MIHRPLWKGGVLGGGLEITLSLQQLNNLFYLYIAVFFLSFVFVVVINPYPANVENMVSS